MIFSTLIIVVLNLFGGNCAYPERDVNSGWLPFPAKNYMVYTTTQYVTDWALVEGVSPSLDYEMWKDNILSLGYDGPLGPFGPLGTLGPLGTNEWDPEYWISGWCAWDEWADLMLYDPLTEDGPLGEYGPYTPDAYYHGQVFYDNEFAPHTRAMGVWGVLGPIGPLGAVGALGALGPIGATGYVRNDRGQFVDSEGIIHTSYTVPYNTSTARTFDLFEQYTPHYLPSSISAANNTPHTIVTNASFLIEDDCCPDSVTCLNYAVHSYPIQSAQDQIITIVVVPTSIEADGLDNIMYLQLLNAKGLALDGLGACVTSDVYVNFIQFTAHANDLFYVQVWPALTSTKGSYRLFVTGSYDQLNQANFVGRYLRVIPYQSSQ